MRVGKKVVTLIIVVLFSFVLFYGCASQEYTAPSQAAEPSYNNGGGYASAPSSNATTGSAKEDAAGGQTSDDKSKSDSSQMLSMDLSEPTDRKVIKEAQISMETANFDKDKETILALVEREGGYVQYSEESGNKPEQWQDPGRTAQYIFRIPQEKFADFLSQLQTIGKQLERTMGGEDITSKYTDVTTRLKTLRTKLDRLEELLAKADAMENIIALENAISDTTLQIEQYTTTLNNWDNLIAEATVKLHISEVVQVSAFEGVKDESFGEKIGNAFNSAIAGIISGFKWLVVAVVTIIPALIVLVVITGVIVVPIVISQKRKKKKLDSGMEPQQGGNGNGSIS